MVDTSLDFPIYSIKAVAHMAGITEPTLRAWEKRYHILTPQRTDSGHRRYTKRDIYRVIWLKNRLEEGMSISQASTLLMTQPDESLAEIIQQEARPGWYTAPGKRPTTNERNSMAKDVRSYKVLANELLSAFIDFDEDKADNILSEAVGLYSPEEVSVEIIQAVLSEIGERWMRNEVTVATEHFASNVCRTRINAMIESLPVVETGPLILTACAPHEFHELGIIITTYFLRRHGWRVIYLGQNVPALDLEKDLRRLRPALVVFSASRIETALSLAQEIMPMVNRTRENWLPGLLFGYGGRAFVEDPNLHDLFKSQLYFGDDSRQSVTLVERILPRN